MNVLKVVAVVDGKRMSVYHEKLSTWALEYKQGEWTKAVDGSKIFAYPQDGWRFALEFAATDAQGAIDSMEIWECEAKECAEFLKFQGATSVRIMPAEAVSKKQDPYWWRRG